MEQAISDNKAKISVKPASQSESIKHEAHKIMDAPLSETIANKVEWLKEETMDTYDSSIQLIRKNPVTSIAVATGVGIVIGMFFKKRH
jgi:ElaB/YqjD/DUF883 family membrane-anchored ribosome-binding protein